MAVSLVVLKEAGGETRVAARNGQKTDSARGQRHC